MVDAIVVVTPNLPQAAKCTLWGGNQIFVRLGGEVFGWELKFHEIPVGGGPTLYNFGFNINY